MYCPACGTSIPDNSQFCLSCGKPIVIQSRSSRNEQGAFWPETQFREWRDSIGGTDGWSPYFTPPSEELELFAKLKPPLDVKLERFMFCSEITGIAIDVPRGPISIVKVEIGGQIFSVQFGWLGRKSAYLLGTDSRLVTYIPKAGKIAQIPYSQIASLDVDRDHYNLHMKDRSIVDVQLRLSRSNATETRNAEMFSRLFSRFFGEIADQNRGA
jgi:hypothetical protein